jgi:predicted N-acyltransferase
MSDNASRAHATLSMSLAPSSTSGPDIDPQLENQASRVVVRDSICDMDPEVWDPLCRDVYMSHGWLQIMEETFTGKVDHRYFLAFLDGEPAGTAACSIQYPSGDGFTLDESIFGRFKPLVASLGVSILPSLICGSIRGYGHHFGLKQDLSTSERQTVMSMLFEALEQKAESLHIPISFNNVLVHETELINMLRDKGFCRTVNFPLNFLDIRWTKFSEYRTFLSKRKLNREINRNRKEGVHIRRLKVVEPCEELVFKLLNDNCIKYNGKPLKVHDNFPSTCKKLLGEEAIIYVAEKQGRIIGTTILFHRDGVGYVTDVGVDHEKTGNDFTYFNVAYYRPVEDAIAMNIRRLYYGTLMYSLKSRRGCSTLQMYLYHRPRNRLMQIAARPFWAAHLRFKTWFINRFYT